MKNPTTIRRNSLPTSLVSLLCAVVAVVGSSAIVAGAAPGTQSSGTERFDRDMAPILARYLQIGDALSKNSLDGVREDAKAISKHAGTLNPSTVTGEHAAHYKDVPANLKKAAQALSNADTLDAARESFKKLSMPMAMWVTMSKPKNIDVVYCSMAKASWVQRHGKVRNPYGSTMLDCGEVVGGDNHEKHKH